MLFLKNEKGEIVTQGTLDHIAKTIGVPLDLAREHLSIGREIQSPKYEGCFITCSNGYFGTSRIIGKKVPDKTSDCIAFDKGTCTCTALRQLYCLWEECRFYKPSTKGK